MNISLTPALEQFVNDKVATGMYNSVSEVIREALRLLISQENTIHKEILDRLNRDIEEGLNDKKSLEGHLAMKKLMEKYG
ncbi:MAG: type II toxin-antitoxin system ParD family antitoxin [Candidatus Gastranaerophilales bacterium]|nr:type II toxin-antitoxin system ParD family antitoxin [Candidatus Gastranaerophilales bacterium]